MNSEIMGIEACEETTMVACRRARRAKSGAKAPLVRASFFGTLPLRLSAGAIRM
jgi:hypothetical protein